MPSTGLADIKEALRRVSLVTGQRFRYAGTRMVIPTARYGGPGNGRFLVAWATARETRGLVNGFIAGVASPTIRGNRIFTGSVVINASWSRTADAGFGSGQPQGQVLMHEFGHLVGLAHSRNSLQVMYSGGPLQAAVWGAADLAGLRKVGRSAGCTR
jgi:hypothetical protein